MPAGNTSLKQSVLIIAAMLGALAVLVQPTAAETWRPGSGWVDPVPSPNPSEGPLCVCAIISGYLYATPRFGDTNAKDLQEFIRDGRNSCGWLAQQELLLEGQSCVVDIFTYFTSGGRCTEHTGSEFRESGSVHSACLLLAPAKAHRFPEY